MFKDLVGQELSPGNIVAYSSRRYGAVKGTIHKLNATKTYSGKITEKATMWIRTERNGKPRGYTASVLCKNVVMVSK